MLKPDVHDVAASAENRYAMVIATAKRARIIAQDAIAEKEILIEKPVSLAVQEFTEGKFRIVSPVAPGDEA